MAAAMAGVMFPLTAFAAEEKTPTRTEKLEITADTPATDMLESEGWKRNRPSRKSLPSQKPVKPVSSPFGL